MGGRSMRRFFLLSLMLLFMAMIPACRQGNQKETDPLVRGGERQVMLEGKSYAILNRVRKTGRPWMGHYTDHCSQQILNIIEGGVDWDEQKAVALHESLIRIVGSDRSSKKVVLPTLEDLRDRPRISIARYLQNNSLSSDPLLSLLTLLQKLGWIEIPSDDPQVFVRVGQRQDIYIELASHTYWDSYMPEAGGWADIGYPDAVTLQHTFWPKVAEGTIRCEVDIDGWCGLRRRPERATLKEGLRRIPSPRQMTVQDGVATIIPLWDTRKGAVLQEDEDLFFTVFTVKIVRPSKSTEANEIEVRKAQEPQIEYKTRVFRVSEDFLEDSENCFSGKT
jgi:hypothetical protein